MNEVVSNANSSLLPRRRRIVELSTVRQAEGGGEQRSLLESPAVSSAETELDRARKEISAALLPLPSTLQRALLVDLCSALNFGIDEVAVANGANAEASFRGVLALVGLARAREMLDELEAVLTR